MATTIHGSHALRPGPARAWRSPAAGRIEPARNLVRPAHRQAESQDAFESPLVQIAVMVLAAALATVIGSILIKLLVDRYA